MTSVTSSGEKVIGSADFSLWVLRLVFLTDLSYSAGCGVNWRLNSVAPFFRSDIVLSLNGIT